MLHRLCYCLIKNSEEREHGESVICFPAGPMMDYILTPICDYKEQVCDNVLVKLLTNGYYDFDDFESIEWKVDFHCRH